MQMDRTAANVFGASDQAISAQERRQTPCWYRNGVASGDARPGSTIKLGLVMPKSVLMSLAGVASANGARFALE
jgi:hypothetical protein